MKIIEIFESIQGEGTLIGIPCIFIRTAGCNFSCPGCDSKYSWVEGTEMSIDEIITKVEKYNSKNIIITGGEPTVSDENDEVYNLCYRLQNNHYIVSIQTNGSKWTAVFSIVDHILMDMKPIFMGEDGKIHNSNTNFISRLNSEDEIKVLVGDVTDLPHAKYVNKIAAEYGITTIIQVKNDYQDDDREDLIKKYKWLVEAHQIDPFIEPVRILPQLHVLIWGNQRGV